MMKNKRILILLVILVFQAKQDLQGQLGLNYTFSYSNPTYQSIAHAPGVEQLLDTTYESYYYNNQGGGSGYGSPFLLNFGTVPFIFNVMDGIGAAIEVDFYMGKIKFNNGYQVNAIEVNYSEKIGPYISNYVSGNDNGNCLGSNGNPAYSYGVEPGNYAFSSKFSSSNDISTVVSTDSVEVCFANQTATSISSSVRVAYFTGRLFYNTIGAAPNRKFIIEFKNFHTIYPSVAGVQTNQFAGANSNPEDLVNFQIILFEGSNSIGIHYGNCINANGNTVGLSNSNEPCDVFSVSKSSQDTQFTLLNNWCDGFGSYSPAINDLLLWSPIDLVDNDGDGFTSSNGDCNENNPAINPSATEICDNIDNNCNTQIDEGFDQDGDGVTTCEGDCNDANAAVYIGAIDVTDGIDNNCDGIIDENFDADGDGVSPADGDCNDANPAIGPTQLEVCNSIDDNCNGQIDEGFDIDNDGYTTCGGDCNDANNLINPGVLDLADGIDNDCDESIDENFDADGDGVTPADGDCNDANPAIGPNQIEYCNGIDDNCNNLIDENFDADNDGFTLCNGDCNDYNAAIYPGAIELDDNNDNNCDGLIDEIFDGDGDGVSPADGDCNDSNPNIGPSALEICNNVDDNCNGLIDEDLDCSTENMDMFVPTGFSPNNDGFNDFWQIPWLVNQSGYSVMVVNRWEQRVFFTNNFGNGWDGTYEGEKLPTADYYYVITLSDGTVLSGALTIKY